MQNSITGILLIFFLWAPIVTFLHELGHATSALLVTRAPIEVKLGKAPRRYHFRLGRLRFSLGTTLNPLLLSTGFCTWDGTRIGHWAHIFILLSGPMASWHQLVVYSVLAYYWQGTFAGWLMQLASFMALSSLALTIFPWRYPHWWGGYGGTSSDGLAVVGHFRALRAARRA